MLKRLFFAAAGSAPVIAARLRKLRSGTVLTILNFHRVAPDDRSSYPPLEPQLFEEVVRFCRREFEPVTFGELDGYRGGASPAVILSFDDGYRDFAEHAMPILRRYGVRVNHNIIPAAVESGLPPLNVHVQDFIGRAPSAVLAAFAVPGLDALNLREPRERLGSQVSSFIKSKPMAEQKLLADVLLPQMRALDGFAPTPMMSLSEVREAAAQHEIGAHSMEHATLSAESDDYVREDARACQQWFRERFGLEPDVYALPNGAGTERTAAILRAEGYRHILWTGERRSELGAADHPRFTITGSSKNEVRFRATGWERR